MSDLASTNWAYPAAQYCARYNLIKVNNGRFYPDVKITRGSFIYALYHLAGAPQVTAAQSAAVEAKFTDFSASNPYHDAAVWANINGILNGVTDTTFGLNDGLRREHAVTFLNRYSNVLSCSFSSTSGPSATTFKDYETISYWARDAMDWASRRYLVQGDKGSVYPLQLLTVAEAAQIVYNFSQKATRGG